MRFRLRIFELFAILTRQMFTKKHAADRKRVKRPGKARACALVS